jgi:ribose transport system substrate-binding protein
MAKPAWIASFTKNDENPNYRAFLLGVERAAAEAGARATRHVPRQPDDPVEQAQLLRAVIAARPDAIIFAPADDRALEAPVAGANAAGIPLIGFVNRMAGDFVTFIGADDVAMGRRIAEVMVGALGGAGDVVLIEGPDTAPTSRDRGQGFRETLARHPGIRLLGTAPGRYLRGAGREAMAALDALEAAGRQALVVGNNGTVEAAQAVGEGRLLASMDYDGFKMGALAAMAALRHLAGEAVPRLILLPVEVVHRGNHAAWLLPVEQRRLPEWKHATAG